MTDQDRGTDTTTNQPGSQQAHWCTRHSSISAHFISNSPATTRKQRSWFSSLLFSSSICQDSTVDEYSLSWMPMNPLNVLKYVGLRCISDWLRRERVIWAAATAATLDKVLVCVWALDEDSKKQRRGFYCTKSPSSGQKVQRSSWVVPLEEDMLNITQTWRQALQVAMKCG